MPESVGRLRGAEGRLRDASENLRPTGIVHSQRQSAQASVLACARVGVFAGRREMFGKKNDTPGNAVGCELGLNLGAERVGQGLLGDDAAEPLSGGRRNGWAPALFPVEVQGAVYDVPSDLDSTSGQLQRAILQGVRAEFMKGETQVLGRLGREPN